MANEIVTNDVTAFIDEWMKAERNGERFPVPFESAWMIAGYARKDNAKRKLESFLCKGSDYSAELRNIGRGKPVEDIRLTCDALKQLCMVAQNEQGRAVRLYFIECEEKWQMVQQQFPQVSEEIELQKLRNEGFRLESQAKQAELQLIQFRHIVTSTMPEPIQQKILGYTEVKDIEYRDRIIHNDDVINDGSTVLKTELCNRYGILTRNGKPDYKRLNSMMDKLPRDAFDLTVRLQDNYELKREYLPRLDEIVREADRNLYLGE